MPNCQCLLLYLLAVTQVADTFAGYELPIEHNQCLARQLLNTLTPIGIPGIIEIALKDCLLYIDDMLGYTSDT